MTCSSSDIRNLREDIGQGTSSVFHQDFSRMSPPDRPCPQERPMDQLAFDFDVSFPHNPPTPERRVRPGRRPRPAIASRSFATPPLIEIVPVTEEAVPATVAPEPVRRVATTTTPSTAVPAAE